VTLATAPEVTGDLREAWDAALEAVRALRGGAELLAENLPDVADPLAHLVRIGAVHVERREGTLVGFAVVRAETILGIFVAPARRQHGVAREIARQLFALNDPPRDALALPGDRATKSLYESLGLKARLLTMRAD
jgi:GNAT superfamily N-acetyltransferase